VLPLLEQLKVAYDSADQFGREVSNFRADVAIPAHNELRYAGHHFLQAVTQHEEDISIDEDNLIRAINHCQRSMYEAADAGIISALDMIKIFQNNYRSVTIRDIIKEYGAIQQAAKDAQDLLARSRSHNEEGQILSEEYVNTFRKLKAMVDVLEDAREDLNKKLSNQQKETRKFIFGLLFTIIAGIVVAKVI